MPRLKRSPVDRFWDRVAIPENKDECWLWTGGRFNSGYGQFCLDGTKKLVHRFAYELLIGPIPAGLHIDHVKARGCTSRLCVNPAHLEAVTPEENTRRGESFGATNARKTHCVNGHAYDEGNTYTTPGGHRECWECKRARKRKGQSAAPVQEHAADFLVAS